MTKEWICLSLPDPNRYVPPPLRVQGGGFVPLALFPTHFGTYPLPAVPYATPLPPHAWSAAAADRAIRLPVDPHAGGPERPEERPAQPERVDWSARYPDEIVLHGPERKEVALTFDDGPDDEWTPQVLRVLDRFGVKATFFVVGQRSERNPSVLRRIVREGHIVGNHSWNHPNLSKMTKEEVRSQLERTDSVIRKVTGKTTRLFRPPYGAISDIVVQEAVRLHKKMILWNVDSLDWMQLTARQVAANVLSHTQPGSFILMHSAGGAGESLQGTVDGLPIVIQSLRRLGYSFRTIPQLLGISAER
jgi:peptidoglycan/xylan/chitin deacetylase (PgdA/CDA1 family)